MEVLKDAGLTVDGFKRMRLPEVIQVLSQKLSDELGVPIETRPDSVIGIIIGLAAYSISDLEELAEYVYYAMYPPTAEGISLDYAVSFSGIHRIQATQTAIIASVYGSPGTTILADSLVTDSVLGTNFRNPNAGEITRNNANQINSILPTYTTGQTVSITISDDGNSEVFSYLDTSDPDLPTEGATPSYVVFKIAQQINDSTIGWSAENTENNLIIKRNDKSDGASVVESSQFQIQRVYSPLLFLAEDAGNIQTQIGNVTRVVTAIAGWSGVVNEVVASFGRDRETDQELRIRYRKNIYRLGSASVDAIRSRLLDEVSNITAAIVFENDTDFIDSDGRPPHSIEAVVEGGLSVDIGRKIFEVKAAGIDTFGSVSEVIQDSMGIGHSINFNRPIPKNIWLRINIERNPEETLPGNIVDVIKNIVIEEGENSEIGKDVILQRFYGPIYRNTTGIGHISITAAMSDDDVEPSTYTEENIILGPRDLAVYDASRIEVAVVG